MEEGREISNNFTCHAWSQDTALLIVCTDNGEILIMENSGEYKTYLLESPVGNCIEAIYSASKSFVVALGNSFMIFKSSMGDAHCPFMSVGDKQLVLIPNTSAQDTLNSDTRI